MVACIAMRGVVFVSMKTEPSATSLVLCFCLLACAQSYAGFKLVDLSSNKDLSNNLGSVSFSGTAAQPVVTKTFRITNTGKSTAQLFRGFSPNWGFTWSPSNGGSDFVFDDGVGREITTSLTQINGGGFLGLPTITESLTAGNSRDFTVTWTPSRRPMMAGGTFYISDYNSGAFAAFEVKGTAPAAANEDPVTNQLLYTFETLKDAFGYSSQIYDTSVENSRAPTFEVDPSDTRWFAPASALPDRTLGRGATLNSFGQGTPVVSVFVADSPPAWHNKRRLRFSDDGAYLGSDGVRLPASDNVGMELWFRSEPDGLKGARMLVGLGAILTDGFGLVLADGVVKARAGAGDWLVGPRVNAVDWHHAALIVQKGAATLFVDGVAYGRRSNAKINEITAGLYLGGGRGLRTFAGEVDSTRVFVAPADFVAPKHLRFGKVPPSIKIDDGISIGRVAPGVTRSVLGSVRNRMARSMHLTSYRMEGDSGFTANLPAEIAFGEAGQCAVSFQPLSVGAASADLVISTDDPLYAQIRIPVAGEGASAKKNLQIYPANRVVDFGKTVMINSVDVPVAFGGIWLSLLGDGTYNTVTASNIAISGPNADDFRIGEAQLFEINTAGLIGDVPIYFSPRAPGLRTATLRFETTDSANPVIEIQLTGDSAGTLPALNVQEFADPPSALMPMGRTVILKVTAPHPLLLRSMNFSGPQASDFSIRRVVSGVPSHTPLGDRALTLPLSLSQMQDFFVEVACQPTVAGESVATLHFDTDASVAGAIDYDLRVQVRPELRVLDQGSPLGPSSSAGSFPQVPVGSSLSHIILLYNAGFAPMTSLNAILNDTTKAFTLSGLAANSLASGASIAMTLTFAPSSVTSASGSLKLSFDGGSQTINLSGTATSTLQPSQERKPSWQTDAMTSTAQDVYLAGSEAVAGSSTRVYRLRRLHKGTEDFSFGRSLPNGRIKAVLGQSDGTFYIVGSFTRVGDVPRQGIARLHGDGSVDGAFIPASGDFEGRALVVLSDGRVLLGGLGSLGGRRNLMLLRPDGSLDTGFTIHEPNGSVNVITTNSTFQNSGNLFVGGAFDNDLDPSGVNAGYYYGTRIPLVNISAYERGWMARDVYRASGQSNARLEVTDYVANSICGYVHTVDSNGLPHSQKVMNSGYRWPQPYLVLQRDQLTGRVSMDSNQVLVAEPGTLTTITGYDLAFALADESDWPPRQPGADRPAMMVIGSSNQLLGSANGRVNCVRWSINRQWLIGGDFTQVSSFNLDLGPGGSPYPDVVALPTAKIHADGFAQFSTTGLTSEIDHTTTPPVVLEPKLLVQDESSGQRLQEGDSIDFGKVSRDTTRQIKITNTSSTETFKSVRVALQNVSSTIYKIELPASTVLAPGGSIFVKVSFQPAWDAITTGKLTITDGTSISPPINVNLWGTVADNIPVNPPAVVGQLGLNTRLQVGSAIPLYVTGYQWQHNGKPIAGANSSSLPLVLDSLSDAGEYACALTTTVGTVWTRSVPVVLATGIELQRVENGVSTFGVQYAGSVDSVDWSLNDVRVGQGSTALLRPSPGNTVKAVLRVGSASLTLTARDLPLLALPVVTAKSFNWQVGKPVDALLDASNNPTQFLVSGLPPGISLDSASGSLSGRPLRSGVYALRVVASNARGRGRMTAIKVTVTGTNTELIAPSLRHDCVALIERDDRLTHGTGGIINFFPSSNGAISGQLAIGRSIPARADSIEPETSERWANGKQVVRFIGKLQAKADGGYSAEVPVKLSQPKNGVLTLILQLDEAGTVSGSMKSGDSSARIEIGGVTIQGYHNAWPMSLIFTPALAEASKSIDYWPTRILVESFADQTARTTPDYEISDGTHLLFRTSVEFNAANEVSGVSSLRYVSRLSDTWTQFRGSADSGNSLRSVTTHVVSGKSN